MYYETDLMTYREARKFLEWFDQEIGTDRELNKEDDDEYYILCCDLTPREVDQLREYENNKKGTSCDLMNSK